MLLEEALSERIVDDFYPSPHHVRARALEMRHRQVPPYSGWRTRAYHPHGIRPRIERAFGLCIGDWSTDTDDLVLGNGSFFRGFERGRFADPVAVHADSPIDAMTLVVYLAPDPPPGSGTSFFEHRATALQAAPTAADARRFGMTVAKLQALLVRDAQRPERWIERGRVENRYNRAVLFRSGALHSATRHFGSSARDGRIYQTFRFGIDGVSGPRIRSDEARLPPLAASTDRRPGPPDRRWACPG